MAIRPMPKPKPSKTSENSFRKLYKNPKVPFACALLIADAVLVGLIIAFVPYTKIDWDAYMSQVDGFLGGERDYSNLKGDTGPLVYPAGFLYIYSAIQFVTGGQVYPAQVTPLAAVVPYLSKHLMQFNLFGSVFFSFCWFSLINLVLEDEPWGL